MLCVHVLCLLCFISVHSVIIIVYTFHEKHCKVMNHLIKKKILKNFEFYCNHLHPFLPQNGGRYSIEVGDRHAFLTIRGADKGDMGDYKLTLTNDLGSDNATIKVQVNGTCLKPIYSPGNGVRVGYPTRMKSTHKK